MIKLSPSALSTFKDCPRCFWLEKIQGIKRPRGIFPSLPGGMDGVIKNYFDVHRLRGTLPPELKGHNVHLFDDQGKLNKWRNWRACDLKYTDIETGAVLSGAVDDVLTNPRGTSFMPFDYKTRGSAPKEALEDYTRKYYGHQIDSYALMLQASGYPVEDHGYFAYYWPEIVEAKGAVLFHVSMVKVKLDLKATVAMFLSAVEVLSHPTNGPQSSPSCEYCNFHASRGGN